MRYSSSASFSLYGMLSLYYSSALLSLPPCLPACLPRLSFYTYIPRPVSHPHPHTHTNPSNRNSTDKRTLIENYDLVSLAIDEIVDDGIILEVDPVVVASRVSRAPAQDVTNIKGVDLSEQGVYNLLEFGKNKLAERMRNL